MKISLKEKLAYGIGDFGCNLVFMSVTSYLFYFYTDVFGLSLAHVGILFLIARSWDAVNELIVGDLVDKTRSRWGKFRPYLLFGALPLSVFAVLTFSTPDFSYQGKLIYAYITYICLGMSYTVISIPYSAMTSAITQDSDERTGLSSVRMIFGVLGGGTVAGLTIPLVRHLGGGNDSAGFTYTMVIYAFFALVILWTTFAFTRERVHSKPTKDKIKLRDKIRVLKHNKPLSVLVVLWIFYAWAFIAVQTVIIYFFKYNIQREDLIPVYMLVMIAALLVGVSMVPGISKKIGKRNTIITGIAIGSTANVLLYLMGYDNLVMFFVVTFFAHCGISFIEAVGWGMLSDTVEYSEWKTGIRAEGLIYSALSFGKKIALAVGGLLISLMLDSVGFIPNAAQTDAAMDGIYRIITIVPAVLLLLGAVTIYFYRLDSNQYNQILEDLNAS